MTQVCHCEEIMHDLLKIAFKMPISGGGLWKTCWSWACCRAAVPVSLCQGWELGAELAAAVLICVLLGRSSGGHWKCLWPAGRGIRQLAAKCPSSFLPSLNHIGLKKSVTVNSLQTIKMGGKYPATEKKSKQTQTKKLYCYVAFASNQLGRV